MKHATTRVIFAYWDQLRGERAAPERGEIEPGRIRHVLADSFILALGPGRETEIRLAGTRMCALFGAELRGSSFMALWPAHLQAEISGLIEAVVDETAGAVAGVAGSTIQGSTVDLEMILLPLRHRGRTHARLLGALSPAVVPSWTGSEALARLGTTSVRMIWPTGLYPERSFTPEQAVSDRRRAFVVHHGGRS